MNKSARTAIHRKNMSAPLRELFDDGVLTSVMWPNKRILDFGCGRGIDVEKLRLIGYKAEGYDPHFQPKKPKGKFQLVLMIYVVNVIEDICERDAAIENAWEYVRRGGRLVIVSRSEDEIFREASDNHWYSKRTYGYVTWKGTYQRGYSPKQLDRLICRNLDLDKVRTIQYGMMQCGASFVIVTKR